MQSPPKYKDAAPGRRAAGTSTLSTHRPPSRGRAPAPRSPAGGRARRRPASLRVRRRRAVALAVLLVVTVLGLVAVGMSGGTRPGAAAPPPPPSTAFEARVVTLAESQVGYRTEPRDSYCNKFSAYWGAGTPTGCPSGLRAEEWCADFAAWVWRHAGAQFTYGVSTGDINAAAGSFYEWAQAHGTWHPATSGYQPQPGDVAVYGLDPTTGSAAHVAIVTGGQPGARGPDVVNGDGDHTGFSVVEIGLDQYKADTGSSSALLSGYASPIRPRRPVAR